MICLPFIIAHRSPVLISSCSEEHVVRSVCSSLTSGLEHFNKSHWSRVYYVASQVCVMLLNPSVPQFVHL